MTHILNPPSLCRIRHTPYLNPPPTHLPYQDYSGRGELSERQMHLGQFLRYHNNRHNYITIIDTIIPTNLTNDAYTYDTYDTGSSRAWRRSSASQW
jgi:hypothetical protein